MIILLTNDDGYQSEGIQVLETVFVEAGHEVWVSAPSDERSAQSHAMTLRGEVKFTRFGERHYHCNGTPADSILYGLHGGALPVKPDVVISGINHGYNVSTDIIYSGTVGAAREAALRGYPGIAISARRDRKTKRFPFTEAATFVAQHLELFISLCNRQTIIIVNVPPKPNGEWRVGSVGRLEYFDIVEKSSTNASTSYDASSTQVGLAYVGADANGVSIGEEISLSITSSSPPYHFHGSLETDYKLLHEGYISVTPVAVLPAIDEKAARTLVALAHKERV